MDRSGSGRDLDGRDAAHRSRASWPGQKRVVARAAAALLLSSWIPAVAHAQAKLTAGVILDRAIKAQGMPKGVDPAADLPLALHVVATTNYTDEKGNKIVLGVERKFLGRKEDEGLVWTRATPKTSKEDETILAFDGERPWLWKKSAGVRWLNEAGGENDRAQLEKDLATTALLTRAFLLRNVTTQLKELERLDDATPPGPLAADLPKCHVLEGKLDLETEGKKKQATLRLFFDQEKSWLLLARVDIAGDAPLQVRFKMHEVEDGLLVPFTIELTWKDEEKSKQIFKIETLDLAPKLIAADFAPPKQ
jgi:hypothetical protein